MSEGVQQLRMVELGAERLKLLGNYAEPLMRAYTQGEFDETAVGERVLQKLIQARILWRPDENLGLKLRPQVTHMIASMIADENRRQTHTEISGELDRIEATVASYKEAQHKGNFSYADLQLQTLTEVIYDLAGQFEEAIDSLWQRLNSHFGFVANLNDKIRENERAQKQIRRLLEGLEIIKLSEMIELAGTSSELRKLLVVYLQQQLTVHHGSLLVVQERMTELLTRFREQQARSLLVSNMAAYLRQHPEFTPGDYAWRTVVPSLVNQSSPLIPAVSIAFERAQDQEPLAEMVAQIPRRDAIRKSSEQSSQPVKITHGEDAQLIARQAQLRQGVEAYFVAALSSRDGEALSALDYAHEQKLSWDPEIWLFQVIAEYQGLAANERPFFQLTYQERPVSYFNQLQLVQDIELKYLG
ncbi:MAG: hypothetical protein HLUCCO02_05980 [Idiomarinaceae bacterium HL-53]|nr:MAG: hypothetical protein HLUCCO02_05980 [Idiomarinaceae bacterium HL-53]CUS48103.1 hypothetical protein Ga0003345_1042 [Idiomarinaceae bacterium HL-53]